MPGSRIARQTVGKALHRHVDALEGIKKVRRKVEGLVVGTEYILPVATHPLLHDALAGFQGEGACSNLLCHLREDLHVHHVKKVHREKAAILPLDQRLLHIEKACHLPGYISIGLHMVPVVPPPAQEHHGVVGKRWLAFRLHLITGAEELKEKVLKARGIGRVAKTAGQKFPETGRKPTTLHESQLLALMTCVFFQKRFKNRLHTELRCSAHRQHGKPYRRGLLRVWTLLLKCLPPLGHLEELLVRFHKRGMLDINPQLHQPHPHLICSEIPLGQKKIQQPVLLIGRSRPLMVKQKLLPRLFPQQAMLYPELVV